MLYREICRILGLYSFGFTFAFLLPLAVALYFEQHNPNEPGSSIYFLQSIFMSLTCALFFYMIGYKCKSVIYKREGIASVVLIWILTPILAGLPFWLSGTLTDPIQAYFEAVSGLTTTGATVLSAKNFGPDGAEIPWATVIPGVIPTTYEYFGTVDPIRDPLTGQIIAQGIEAVPRGLLFWRSFLQWLGGVGVVVLFVAILPALGIGGKLLFQAEMTGPIKDTMTPRIKETAMRLWKIYIVLTLFQILVMFLVMPQLHWFDAAALAFSTISTGGFSVKNEGIAAYQSPGLEWTLIIFMIMGSINFSLYYFLSKGKFYKFYEPEFLLFLSIIACASLLTIWKIYGHANHLLNGDTTPPLNLSDATRYGAFQTVSAMTSTGFSTANYDLWPYAAQIIIFIIIFVGGMSGSTSGGMKVIRHFMIFRIVQNKVESLFHPESIKNFNVGNRGIDSASAMMVMSFFVILISLATLGTVLYVFNGVDLETALGLSACMINNGGMAFRAAGPLGSCAFLSDFGLIISSMLMIFGRLEFFAFLSLLVPAFWSRNS